jgi:LPXTG-site transpeptidase (sortase) family protein
MKPKTENSSKISSKKGAKKLLKPFLLLFLINFLIINWNDVSWVFNYRVISGITSRFFERVNNQISSIGNKISNKINSLSQLININYSNKENSLEIPKIGVSAPLIIVEDLNEKDLNEKLDRGVVLFSNSTSPDQAGQMIIFGHSAPPNWPKIKYDWVFSRLNELEEEDEINFYFNNQKYTYYVKNKIFLERGEEIPNNSTNSENTLLLISCWPPGNSSKRIVVEAALIKT